MPHPRSEFLARPPQTARQQPLDARADQESRRSVRRTRRPVVRRANARPRHGRRLFPGSRPVCGRRRDSVHRLDRRAARSRRAPRVRRVRTERPLARAAPYRCAVPERIRRAQDRDLPAPRGERQARRRGDRPGSRQRDRAVPLSRTARFRDGRIRRSRAVRRRAAGPGLRRGPDRMAVRRQHGRHRDQGRAHVRQPGRADFRADGRPAHRPRERSRHQRSDPRVRRGVLRKTRAHGDPQRRSREAARARLTSAGSAARRMATARAAGMSGFLSTIAAPVHAHAGIRRPTPWPASSPTTGKASPRPARPNASAKRSPRSNTRCPTATPCITASTGRAPTRRSRCSAKPRSSS
ncbi:hypothetical protein F01_460270 [Burkholderia cenocepacia]|nr:hypothetical protein F01_460270 [Burkholderia cenocepacia]